MNTIKTIIIDDEEMAIKNLSLTINKYCPELSVIGEAQSLNEGIKLIKTKSPDLVFLDINLSSSESGFDLLELFPNRNFHVVFVTAYPQYGMQAIKQHAFDYILKPIDHTELVKTVNELIRIHYSAPLESTSTNNVIPIPTSDGTHILHPDEILFCKAEGSYTTFKLVNNRTILLSKSIKHAEQLLTDSRFKRVHRSYIINVEKVKKYHHQGGGLVEIEEDLIPISKTHVESFTDLFS